jgi:phenylacetate-CoA ligase
LSPAAETAEPAAPREMVHVTVSDTRSNALTHSDARPVGPVERGSPDPVGRTCTKNRLLRAAGHTCAGPGLRRLLATDFAGQSELERLQERKLGRLLRHAGASVPLYAEMLAQIAGGLEKMSPFEVLRELPFLTKREISANFPDRMLSGGRRPRGSQHLYSSGTTADRIDVIVGPSGQLSRLALVLWRHRLGGGCPLGSCRVEIPPDACSRICGADTDRPPGMADEVRSLTDQGVGPLRATLRTAERRLRAGIRHGLIYDRTLPPFGPGGTAIPDARLQEYLEAIRGARPHLLSGLPTYLHQLARYLQRSGQRLHVPVVHPMGALSTEGQRAVIGQAFGARVYDTYGSSELGTFSAQCEERGHLHVAMSSYIVEVVRDGRTVGEGELGEIAVTSLDNYAMPLIRYKVGDVGRWYRAGCPCGRTSQMIECNGRLQALVVTRAGTPVTEEDLMNLAYSELGLEHFQLVEHRPGRFDLLVVAAPDAPADLHAVGEAFARVLDRPEQLEVFPVDTIYPEATGKFRFVKSASFGSFGRPVSAWEEQ